MKYLCKISIKMSINKNQLISYNKNPFQVNNVQSIKITVTLNDKNYCYFEITVYFFINCRT